MSNKIKFYPLGNADCCLIKDDNGHIVIIDYGYKTDDEFDLPVTLKSDIGHTEEKPASVDILAFSHFDDDHVKGATELFYLEHAEKYKEGDRIRVKELWVPAAAIVEPGVEDDARALRQEARYRLKQKKGIKVFGSPEYLEEYLDSDESGDDVKYEDIKDLIYHAGNTISQCDMEFFIHAPFSSENDDKDTIKRNSEALAFQTRFSDEDRNSNVLFLADLDSDVLEKVVEISEANENEDKLDWDILKVPHHCSYTALNKEEKGREKTKPIDAMKRLLGHGRTDGYIVVTSKTIENKDSTQPPHFQAHNTYKEYASTNKQKVLVTSDSEDGEEFEIDSCGIKRNEKRSAAIWGATAVSAPRVGKHES